MEYICGCICGFYENINKMCSTALPDIERCRQVFPFKLSIYVISISGERGDSLFLSSSVCACKIKDLVPRSFSHPSAIFIEASFGFFFTSSFFARICVYGVDNIVSVYRPPIYRLDKSALIAVYVNRIDRCIATRKYSLQK